MAKFDTKFDITSATKPLYAGIGATDLAVERVRGFVTETQKRTQQRVAEAQKNVRKVELEPKALRDQAATRVDALAKDAKARRAAIEKRVAEAQADALATVGGTYDVLVTRGVSLVTRIRGQEATQATTAAAKTAATKAKSTKTQATKATKSTASTAKKSASATKQTAAKKSAPAKSSAKATGTAAKETASNAAQATGVLDGAAGGVDPDGRVVGLLVGRGDAGEVGDLAAPGLGVEALAVPALALLEGGGDVHEEEGAAGRVDHLAHLGAGLGERRDRAADREPAVAGDLGGDPADAADVGLAVLAGEREPGRQVAAHDVAVEAGDRALAALEHEVHECPGQRRLAAAGEAREEQHQALVLGGRLVRLDDRRHVVGPDVVVARLGEGVDRVVAGVRRHDLDAEDVVGLGVAVGGERDRDHLCREPFGHEQRGPQRRHGGESGGAGADEGEQHDRAVDRGELGELALGEGVGDRDERGARVTLPDLRRREVVAPERAVLVVGQGGDLARGRRDPREREPLGVDQLDGPGVRQAGREGERHRAARLVEAGDRGERPGGEQLEVVELARGGAVLRHGLVWHVSILPPGRRGSGG